MKMRSMLGLIAGLWLGVACAQAQAVSPSTDTTPQACTSGQPAPALPLHTLGAQIVDANNQPFKLSGVAWYGSEGEDFVVGGLQLEPLDAIAHSIRCLGFNAVRLPWSNEMYESNPKVPDYALTANPQLMGMHALAVYTQVVDALAAQGLLVILDNHNSNAEWCCSDDGNDLWYNADYPESSWIADWEGLVKRFKDVPQVVAADLRNEPRITATWGGSAATDWHAAAERGGAAVLSVNPKLLIMVEGVSYSLDLTGVASLPVVLPIANKLVYSPHDYPFDHSNYMTASQLQAQLATAWGYIVTPGESYTAPIWLGEFGNCHTDSTCVTDTTADSSGLWFSAVRQYIQQTGISWSWWAINGTETTGAGRTFGSEETYGVLNPYWNAPAIPNEFNPTDNVADALASIAQLSPTSVANTPELQPLVSVVTPVPGDTVAAGSALTLTANANVVAGSTDAIASVQLYADGRPIGDAVTGTSPYTLTWAGIPKGSHTVAVLAQTDNGLTALSQAVPVQATNYAKQRPAYKDGIAINFVSYAVTPMQPTETAGVIPQMNWNQAGVQNAGTLSGLVDTTGVATTASVSWAAPDTYSTTITAAPGNNNMMKGYLDNSNTVPSTVSVSGVPWKQYDLIVYFDGGNEASGTTPGSTRAANFRFTALDSSGQVHGCAQQGVEGSTISGADAGGVDFSGAFVQASNGSAGNYVVFRNCSGGTFQLAPVHGQSQDSQVRAPINGLQILALP